MLTSILSRTIFSVFLLVFFCSSVKADPITVNLNITSGSLVSINFVGFDDHAAISLVADNFSAIISDGETRFMVWGCGYPLCTNTNVTYLGQTSARISYGAGVDLNTNTASGAIFFFAPGSDPLRGATPIYIFTFTAIGEIVVNTPDRFEFRIIGSVPGLTEIPEPASLLLMGIGFIALMLQRRSYTPNV